MVTGGPLHPQSLSFNIAPTSWVANVWFSYSQVSQSPTKRSEAQNHSSMFASLLTGSCDPRGSRQPSREPVCASVPVCVLSDIRKQAMRWSKSPVCRSRQMTVRFLGGYGENYDRCVAECTHKVS